ncbi:MAG TPA: type II toxin-antitoxin system VapC family toxin [Candidatus Nitrosotalea sp.]|nr:type II toxin-antitoxin system VapC family toxin [Candidatus Nitrosotalea sp.]
MRLLLDTHVWLWMGSWPERLGANTREEVSNPANGLFLSIASAWEITEKKARGKLELPMDVATYLTSRLAHSQANLLTISLEHIFALRSLPEHHRDPFDRMIVAQALAEGMQLVTADTQVLSYPVATLDARQ